MSTVARMMPHFSKANGTLRTPPPTIVATRLKMATTSEEHRLLEANGGSIRSDSQGSSLLVSSLGRAGAVFRHMVYDVRLLISFGVFYPSDGAMVFQKYLLQ